MTGKTGRPLDVTILLYVPIKEDSIVVRVVASQDSAMSAIMHPVPQHLTERSVAINCGKGFVDGHLSAIYQHRNEKLCI